MEIGMCKLTVPRYRIFASAQNSTWNSGRYIYQSQKHTEPDMTPTLVTRNYILEPSAPK